MNEKFAGYRQTILGISFAGALIWTGCSGEGPALQAAKEQLFLIEAQRDRLSRKLDDAYREISKLETEVAQLQMAMGGKTPPPPSVTTTQPRVGARSRTR